MITFDCECGTTFYRFPRRLTECPTCCQVVVDVDGQTIKVFENKPITILENVWMGVAQ